jgi:hypothetical protein
MDQDRLAPGELGLVEQAPPGCHGDDGNRCSFDMVERGRFARNHVGRRHGVLGVGTVEARIGDAVDGVADLQTSDVRPDCGDLAG